MAQVKKKKFTKKVTGNLYSEIANKIIDALEKGVRPWEQCYSIGGFAGNALRVTGDEYQGINRILLSIAAWEKGYTSPVWMTYNQASKLGGKVRKGEKASLSVFYGTHEVGEPDPETNEKETRAFIKRNNVFNISQIDGLPSDFIEKYKQDDVEMNDNQPIDKAEKFIANIPATVIELNATPAFIPSKDTIRMPNIGQFRDSESYYATFLHELIHWTKAKDRLDRPSATKRESEIYYREELVAEVGACILCALLGLDSLIDSEHAPYISDYLTLLKDDPKSFFWACSQAEKAVNFLKAYQ